MEKVYKKLTLRLSEEQYAHLMELTEAAGMKAEPMIRQLVMGTQLRPRPPNELAQLLREVSAIGNNLNQIAYWANAKKGISSNEIQNAVSLVQDAWERIQEQI